MAKKHQPVLHVVLLIGLAFIVVLGKQWWRLSHHLGVSMFSPEAIQSFLPYLALAAVVICAVVAYWLITDRAKGADSDV